MKGSTSQIQDNMLRAKTTDAIEEFTDAVSTFGEQPDLVREIGKKHKNLIDQESNMAKERVAKQFDAFSEAVHTVDRIE